MPEKLRGPKLLAALREPISRPPTDDSSWVAPDLDDLAARIELIGQVIADILEGLHYKFQGDQPWR